LTSYLKIPKGVVFPMRVLFYFLVALIIFLPSLSYADCTTPPDCQNVGDVCADGSQFAGFMIYNTSTCEVLFVTDANQSTEIQWKTSQGINDIATDSHGDGKKNQSQVSPISSFPAFELCEHLNRHSQTDWYLPAHLELHLLRANRVAIDANATEAFTEDNYWAATEFDTVLAWNHHFLDDHQLSNIKTNNYDVRCVRRD